jgi:hypothetical protein
MASFQQQGNSNSPDIPFMTSQKNSHKEFVDAECWKQSLCRYETYKNTPYKTAMSCKSMSGANNWHCKPIFRILVNSQQVPSI